MTQFRMQLMKAYSSNMYNTNDTDWYILVVYEVHSCIYNTVISLLQFCQKFATCKMDFYGGNGPLA